MVTLTENDLKELNDMLKDWRHLEATSLIVWLNQKMPKKEEVKVDAVA